MLQRATVTDSRYKPISLETPTTGRSVEAGVKCVFSPAIWRCGVKLSIWKFLTASERFEVVKSRVVAMTKWIIASPDSVCSV